MTGTAFDPARVRADFAALDQQVHDKPLVYLDSAATALKPRQVVEAVARVYNRDCANIHRSSAAPAPTSRRLTRLMLRNSRGNCSARSASLASQSSSISAIPATARTIYSTSMLALGATIRSLARRASTSRTYCFAISSNSTLSLSVHAAV